MSNRTGVDSGHLRLTFVTDQINGDSIREEETHNQWANSIQSLSEEKENARQPKPVEGVCEIEDTLNVFHDTQVGDKLPSKLYHCLEVQYSSNCSWSYINRISGVAYFILT